MTRLLLATCAGLACAQGVMAQELIMSGFLEFESHFGENYDSSQTTANQVTQLDFAIDGRLNFDYANATESGLEYGAHFELDFYQSDDDNGRLPTANVRAAGPYFGSDIAAGDLVEFNDGYVFIKSALGTLSLGDTGFAGKAKNQLHVPILPFGAFEIDQWNWNREIEQVFYSNSFLGLDFEASIDDDAAWSLGLGFDGSVGALDVALGLSAGRSNWLWPVNGGAVNYLSGSLELSSGGVSTGVNYSSMDMHQFLTFEYVAAGADYTIGPLTVGAGVETAISHNSFGSLTETYATNYFAGASYELADGLIVALGVGNLDANVGANRANVGAILLPMQPKRAINAIGSVKVEY